MARKSTEQSLTEIVAVLRRRRGGATIVQIAAALPAPPPPRQLQRWLSVLVQRNHITRLGSARAVRYALAEECEEDAPLASPEGQAVWRLVKQPMADGLAVDYRRIVLDTYRPNRTYYLSADVRAQLGASASNATGLAAWRDPAALTAFLTDFVWRSCWLEVQLSDRGAAVLSQPEVAQILAQSDGTVMRREVQLARNQKAAFELLLAESTPPLTLETLGHLHAALFARLVGNVGRLGLLGGAKPASLLRTVPLALPNTAYVPPSDAWLIESCCGEVLAKAAEINDPIERSFFVLMHLLYLQPFASMNASLACLAANIPLLGAGLPPFHFGAIGGTDLLAAMRGVWELARPDLLRDLFVAACGGATAAVIR